MHIAALHVWPVKGCAGLSVTAWPVDARGLLLDRAWMLVDAAGQFLSQRSHPQLARVHTALPDAGGEPGMLLLRHDARVLRIPLQPSSRPTPVRVQVWRDVCEAWDEGDAAAAWFAELGVDARLVRMTDAWQRQVDPVRAPAGTVTGFSDGFPLLVTTTASLDELNRHLQAPVEMVRFRPNVVVAGATPWAEESWRELQVAAVRLRLVKPCARCQVPAVDPQTGIPGKEPVLTLARLHRVGSDVLFGMNALASPGWLHVGDAVRVDALSLA